MNKKNTEYFQRDISKLLRRIAGSFPVIVLTGPRQSGKTTLLKWLFPERSYVNLEEPDTLQMIRDDVRTFLAQDKLWIIDEIQRLPELFSYIQSHVDKHNDKAGLFILSGSQNFLLSEKVSQTLAGRAAILELLPLSYLEYLTHPVNNQLNVWEFIYHGGYPRPYQEKLDLNIWFNSYIRTYLERDVRQIKHINDLGTFQRFLKLCAGRHGQQLNLSNLANDVGVSQSTISEWINILEASYIVYRLQPYYKNYKKRIVKTPKLYFYDTAIVCQLLGIESTEHLTLHSARGALFEGLIISEVIKHFFAKGKTAPIYYWRDHRGVEIDLIIAEGSCHQAIEIKSGATYNSDYLKNLQAWKKYAAEEAGNCQVIYTGGKSFSLHDIKINPWGQFLRELKSI